MQVVFGSRRFSISDMTITNIESIKSGKIINKINGNIRIEKQYDPEKFKNQKIVELFDEITNETKKYTLSISQSSYSNNSSYWTFMISCEEVEDYVFDEIEIDKKMFKVYDYSENIEQNSLIINLKTMVEKDGFDKIKGLIKNQYVDNETQYFTVKRKGIADRIMRFGQPLWSVFENKYKVRLIIVEKKYDEVNKTNFKINEPDMSNVKNILAETNIKIENLINMLISKNVLTETERTEIETLDEQKIFDEKFKMKNVDDIDTYEE
jgi:hypothetical protein